MRSVLVRGAGVAALTYAWMLAQRGCAVTVRGPRIPRVPAIVVNAVTAGLLREVWGFDPFTAAHALAGRHVSWDAGADTQTVTDPSFAISGTRLVAELAARLSTCPSVDLGIDAGDANGCSSVRDDGAETGTGQYDWVVETAPTRASDDRRPFGARRALVAIVALREAGESSWSILEAVEEGWVFLAPFSPTQGVLQAVVPEAPADPLRTLIRITRQTREIRGRMASPPRDVAIFGAAPRLSDQLYGDGWIAIGEAALTFDPLSGDGTGTAVRCAILAAAVTDLCDPPGLADALAHYDRRLRTAFREHLRACITFYERARSSAIWSRELDMMRSGQLRVAPANGDWKFRLRSSTLERIG